MVIAYVDTKTIYRLIEMAWEDCTPFDAIKHQFDLAEKDVTLLMRKGMKHLSFTISYMIVL